jgi:transposase
MKSFLPASAAAPTGRRWFGLDLAKRESQLAVLDDKGALVAQKRFATTRENILALAGELGEQDTLALEVTTNANAIARLLRSNSKARLIMSNPIKTKLIAKAKVKTDKIDARVLAELARVDYLPEVWLPDEDTESLRQFFSDRRSLVDRRTELKNTVHSVLHRNLIQTRQTDIFGTSGRKWLDQLVDSGLDIKITELDRLRLGSLLTEIDRQDLLVKDQDAIIASFVATRPDLRKQLDLLVTIPGVSMVVGAGVLAAIGDIKRFASAKKLAAYFGVVPSTRQSGDREAKNGRITKQGRSEARWLLVEAAEHLRKAPGPLRALFQRINRQRGHNVAVVAVARKLAELVFHLLTKEREYLYAVPKRTLDKRSAWRLMARRKIGVEFKRAEYRAGTTGVLYGTGQHGPSLKREVVRRAAEQAERLYSAMVKERASADKTAAVQSEDLVFDPMKPVQTDWEKVLSKVAEKLLAAKKVKA